MPREFVLVTRRMPDTDDLRAAAAICGVENAKIARARDGALDLVLDVADRVVLSVEYTQVVAVPDEVERLAPAAASVLSGEVFWTEAWARDDSSAGSTASAEIGARVAAALAVRCDGVCVLEDGSLA